MSLIRYPIVLSSASKKAALCTEYKILSTLGLRLFKYFGHSKENRSDADKLSPSRFLLTTFSPCVLR